MGSSYVDLGEKIPADRQTPWLGETYGFWVKDYPLLVWLSALGEIVDEQTEIPEWLKEMRERWKDAYQAVGCVVTGFEDYLIDDDRRLLHYPLVIKTLERLLENGGDYERAFPSTKQLNDGFPGPQPLGLSVKVGLIELGTNIGSLLLGYARGGEHTGRCFGYAPDMDSAKFGVSKEDC